MTIFSASRPNYEDVLVIKGLNVLVDSIVASPTLDTDYRNFDGAVSNYSIASFGNTSVLTTTSTLKTTVPQSDSILWSSEMEIVVYDDSLDVVLDTLKAPAPFERDYVITIEGGGGGPAETTHRWG